MAETEASHIDPRKVLELAGQPQVMQKDKDGRSILEVCETVGGERAFLVRNFHVNFADTKVSKELEELTGYPAEELHRIVELIAPHDTRGSLLGKSKVF